MARASRPRWGHRFHRVALGIIEDAEASGELQPGQTVIEATSGNTDIGLAMVCAQKDYPLVVTMAESGDEDSRHQECDPVGHVVEIKALLIESVAQTDGPDQVPGKSLRKKIRTATSPLPGPASA